MTWSNSFIAHDHVLDLRAADPLDADRELAGDHRLADHREQWPAAAAQPRPAVNLDDDAQNVEADRRLLVPTSLKASRPVFCDSMRAGRSMKNGSALRPA